MKNAENLRKPNIIIRRIIDTVQRTVTKKFSAWGRDSGRLWIWKLDISHQRALPGDLCLNCGKPKASRIIIRQMVDRHMPALRKMVHKTITTSQTTKIMMAGTKQSDKSLTAVQRMVGMVSIEY